MNSALAALLRGNNTTISIAHRLSTIKRSDTIIVLGNDGRVAEQGSYRELSSRKDGAFTKLMEWQMSGGETPGAATAVGHDDTVVEGQGRRGPPTEKEELQHRLTAGHHAAGEEGDGEMEMAEGSEGRIEGSKVQEVVESAVEKGAGRK